VPRLLSVTLGLEAHLLAHQDFVLYAARMKHDARHQRQALALSIVSAALNKRAVDQCAAVRTEGGLDRHEVPEGVGWRAIAGRGASVSGQTLRIGPMAPFTAGGCVT
jgi:hypothetical protein